MDNFKVVSLPGGEQHVKYIGAPLIPGEKKIIRIKGVVSSDKVIALSMALDILSRNGIEDVTAVIPYLPGARQDRVQDKLVGLDAHVYAKLIAASATKQFKIIALDPHSEAAISLYADAGLEVSVIHHQEWFLPWIESTTFAPGPHKFLFPDKGAAEKYGKVSAYSPFMSCTKNRDHETGKITGFTVPDLRRFAEDQFLWVVDDICDGGATFIHIAKEVRSQLHNKVRLGLAISHGIFSNFNNSDEMNSLFDYIVTTDSVTEGKLTYPTRLQVQPLDKIARKGQ